MPPGSGKCQSLFCSSRDDSAPSLCVRQVRPLPRGQGKRNCEAFGPKPGRGMGGRVPVRGRGTGILDENRVKPATWNTNGWVHLVMRNINGLCRVPLGIAGLLSVIALTPAYGEALPDRLGNALRVLDERASDQYQFSDRLRPDTGRETGIPRYTGGYAGPWLDVARGAARRHGIPEELFLRLVHQESAWNTSAVSSAGALGLAQLMPDTAVLLGVDPHDPADNLDGGARYLAQQYRDFGRWDLALAAYNAGPGMVRQYDGVPPFAETQAYVRIILGSG